MPRAYISGTGSFVPERVMTNAEVCRLAPGCLESFIVEKLGIHERRIAAKDEQTSDLAVHAANRAIEASGIDRNRISGLICSVSYGDVPVPATACYIQEKLGLSQTKCFAFDIRMACAGAIGGTMVARSLIESGMAEHVLVIGTQIISRTILDWTDRTTAPLFGDGAGAVIVSRSPDGERGFLETRLHTDGTLTGIVGQYIGGTQQWFTPESIQNGEVKLVMDGRAVWDCAVDVLPKVIHDVVRSGGYTLDDVDFVVAHQANKRLLYHVLERAGVPLSKTYTNIEKYANTVAASAFIALDECVRLGHVEPNDLIVFLAIGAGMTWGAHLIRW